MPAGFEIYNSAGKKIADQESYCIQFHSKGTATTGALSGLSTNLNKVGLEVAIPAGLVDPFIAFSHFSAIAPIGSTTDGVTTVHKFMSSETTTGVGIPYYVFELAKNVVAKTNFGIEVYDAGGNLTFSSNGYFAVVKLAGTGSLTIPAGRTYAAGIASFAGSRFQSPTEPASSQNYQDSDIWGAYAGRDTNGDGVLEAGFLNYAFQSQFLAAPAPDYSVPFDNGLIIDVTPFA